MVLKFAANLNFLFTECSTMAERIYVAHRTGFRAIEIPFPSINEAQQMLKAQSETGIHVTLMNIALGDGDYKFGTASIPGAEEDFKQQLYKSISMAHQLNCPKIHIMSGLVKDQATSLYLETYEKNLNYAVTKLQEENLTGVIEPINNYSVPSYFMNNYKTAIAILKALNNKHLQLMVDMFHLQQICGNVTNSFKEMSDFIGHIQIAQVPHRHEPDIKGEIDFEYLFSLIEQSGYNDWIGCEYKPKTNTINGLKWLQKYGYQL